MPDTNRKLKVARGFRSLRRQSNAFAGPDYWNEMTRSICFVRPGVVDFATHLDRRFRVLMLSMAVFLLLFFAASEVLFSERDRYPFERIVDTYLYITDFEDYAQKQVDHGIGIFSNVEDFIATYGPHWEDGVRSRLIEVAIVIGVPVIMIFIALLAPRRAPVRYDLNRGVLYTWRANRLWCVPQEKMTLQTRKPFYALGSVYDQHDADFGYVTLRLFDENNDKLSVSLGCYPPTRVDHNEELIDVIVHILEYPDTDMQAKLQNTAFRPFDIARWLHRFSLRQVPSLDAVHVQDALNKALSDA